MARNLDFKALDETKEEEVAAGRSWRQRRREANPTVQMSVRMQEDVYERFRMLCERERRTNGDMLAVMMESYLRTEQHK